MAEDGLCLLASVMMASNSQLSKRYSMASNSGMEYWVVDNAEGVELDVVVGVVEDML